MPNDLYGLPIHPLIVHATVVIVPLAALLVLLAGISRQFRTRAGIVPMLTSLVGVILIPLSTSSGETLERHVRPSALVEEHQQLADGLLPWMIAVLVIAVAMYGLQRRSAAGHTVANSITIAVAVVALVATAGSTVQIVKIGHSGAKAAWAKTDMSRSVGQ